MSSDLFNSAWLTSDEADKKNYLYVARDDSQPIFHGLQEDMAQLNDFCFLCVEGASKHLAELQRTVKRYRTGEEQAKHPDFGDISDEVAWGLEEFDIPRWQDTEQFMVRAMCLILLSAFVEKCLKEFASYFAPPEALRFKRKGGEGETIREKCRSIRNDFAHGRWDDVKASMPISHYLVRSVL